MVGMDKRVVKLQAMQMIGQGNAMEAKKILEKYGLGREADNIAIEFGGARDETTFVGLQHLTYIAQQTIHLNGIGRATIAIATANDNLRRAIEFLRSGN